MTSPDSHPSPADPREWSPRRRSSIRPRAGPARGPGAGRRAARRGGRLARGRGASSRPIRSALNPKIQREVDPEAVRQIRQGPPHQRLGHVHRARGDPGAGPRAWPAAWPDAPPRPGSGRLCWDAWSDRSPGPRSRCWSCPTSSGTHDPQSQDLTLPMLTLGSIGSAVGAAGGLAFGLGLGGRDRWSKSLFGGLLGAALGVGRLRARRGPRLPDRQDGTRRSPIPSRPGPCSMSWSRPWRRPGSALALGLSGRRAPPRPRREARSDAAGLVERSRRGRPCIRTMPATSGQ